MNLTQNLPDAPLAPCALQQHPRYGKALRSLGADVACLTGRAAGGPVAHTQIVLRRFGPVRLAWIPRGPVWAKDASDSDKAVFLNRLLPQIGTTTGLICQPDTPEEAPPFHNLGCARVLSPQFVAELDLTPPASARRAAQHGKWRNRLRHAENSALCTSSRWYSPARDTHVLHHETCQRRARGYAALPPAFTLAWDNTTDHAARLFTARLGTGISAFMLVLLHAPTATYHLGWSGDAGRRHSAHNLLLWQAANWLAAHGYQRFDLGSVDTENTPGLARFKIGSGARVRPLGPTLLRLPGIRHFRRFYRSAA